MHPAANLKGVRAYVATLESELGPTWDQRFAEKTSDISETYESPCPLELNDMGTRPIWRGHLRLALVSCPVALFSARHDRGAIHFHMINPETGNRIKMITEDAETGQELKRGDTTKGFESVRVESSATMTVEKFVEANSIDPIYYDASYYLAPDGKAADDVYAVLREAIEKTGRVALTRVVIAQRERTIAIRPMNGGLVAHTLNEDRDLNSSAGLFEEVQRAKIDPEMVTLATQLIDRQTGRYDPADLEDRYETRLRAMIEAKVKGLKLEDDEEPEEAPSNVIDLMAALKRSLGKEVKAGATATKPTKAPRKASAAKAEQARRQPALKLPIVGGGKKVANMTTQAAPKAPTAASKGRRKAS
jgi:DNA end-binding protein Ku